MDLLIQELMKYLPAGQLLSIVLLLWILTKINKINEAMIELSAWRDGHIKEDDGRFKQLADWLNRHNDG